MTTIRELIELNVRLDRPNTRGWYPCVHQGCDHGRKGNRAAFLFPDDDSAIFKCYNCGTITGYAPARDRLVNQKMRKVLSDFFIPDDEIRNIELQHFAENKEEYETQEKERIKIEPDEIEVPDYFYFLDDAKPEDKWAQVAKAILESRAIDPDSYPFMLSSKVYDKWHKRIIIPVYKQGKLIYYSGRDMTDRAKKKYENPDVEKFKVLFGFKEIFEYTDKPIYIVEGVMDALPLPNMVALMGNEISEAQIEWLNKTHRQKIYVPDRWGNGKPPALKAISLGWSISTPEIGDVKDLNDAVVKYGKLYVIKTLGENIHSGEIARIMLGLYCV